MPVPGVGGLGGGSGCPLSKIYACVYALRRVSSRPGEEVDFWARHGPLSTVSGVDLCWWGVGPGSQVGLHAPEIGLCFFDGFRAFSESEFT